jgi:hypothetical protein
MRGKPHFPPPGIISGAFNDSFIPGNFPPIDPKGQFMRRVPPFPLCTPGNKCGASQDFFPPRDVFSMEQEASSCEKDLLILLTSSKKYILYSHDSFHHEMAPQWTKEPAHERRAAFFSSNCSRKRIWPS